MNRITAEISRFARTARLLDMPEEAKRQGRRTLLNYFGCACGGSDHKSVGAALRARTLWSTPGTATLIGRDDKVDPSSAALLNGMSSAVYSFDDTHAEAIVHPGGPVASALLALCGKVQTDGADCFLAFVIGAEIVCRLSKAISVEPACARTEWLQTSVCGGIGAALACSSLLGLTERQMVSAIGIAASRASGFRGLSRSMCFSYMAGSAAEAGLQAALMAQCGVEGPEEPLNGDQGFCAVFSQGFDLDALTSDLGNTFELTRNTFKPYPCGVVIHPVIDGCLEMPIIAPEEIERVTIAVNPLVQRLADLPEPADQFEAQMSIQHWAASALLLRRAGIEHTMPQALEDQNIISFRRRVAIVPDPDLSRNAVRVKINLTDRRELTRLVKESKGSLGHPLSDTDLEAKFLNQAVPKLGEDKAHQLARACWEIENVSRMANMLELAQKES